jgi:hypothetical protein
MNLRLQTNSYIDLDSLAEAIHGQVKKDEELLAFILDLDARKQSYDFTVRLRDRLDEVIREEDAWEELKQKKETEHA